MPPAHGSNVSTLPAPQQVAILTQKLYDADSDIRFMSLNDLLAIFNNNSAAFLHQDYDQCAKTVQGFLRTLNDTNGEVQNMTIRCLGPFAVKADPELLCPLIHKIANLPTDNTVDSSISAMAVRAIVVALPRPTPSTARTKGVHDAYDAISRVLIPRLVGRFVLPKQASKGNPEPPKGLLVADMEEGTDSGSIDVLTELARCFGPMLDPLEVTALQSISIDLLASRRTGSVMKKKAVIALSALSLHFSDESLSQVISQILENLTNPHLAPSNRRLWIGVLGSMAKSTPAKFGPHLKTLLAFVYTAVSQEEIDEQAARYGEDQEIDPAADEVRETALITLDSFLTSCEHDMQGQDQECLSTALRFLKYDPNVTELDSDEYQDLSDEQDELDSDQDFEEEGALDNEDDVSWKVRRAAAKFLQTMMSIRSKVFLEDPEAFDHVARALVNRFQEREESIRLEILRTLDLLIKITEEDNEPELNSDLNLLEESIPTQISSRKRRRGQSDVSLQETTKFPRLTGSVSPDSRSPPRSGPIANLVKVSPEIVHGIMKLIKSGNSATKQAAVSTLRALVVARRGGLADWLKDIFVLTTDQVKSTKYSLPTLNFAGGTNLQNESLKLLSEVIKYHSSKDIEPYLGDVISSVSEVAKNASAKTSCEALRTIEQLIKALTPPRNAHVHQKSSDRLETLRKTLSNVISARNNDLATRQQSISVLGIALGRTMDSHGSALISDKAKFESYEILSDTLRNETTRLATIRAINSVGRYCPPNPALDVAWFSRTTKDLGGQLRKADRSLRTTSLAALWTFIVNKHCSSNIDESSRQHLIQLLIQVLSSDDLQMIGPTLDILAAILKDSKTDFATHEDFIMAMCHLLPSLNASPLLDHICGLVELIGKHGLARPLMRALLKNVGINGSPNVVGKAIGSLSVASGTQSDVKTEDFLNELQTTPDDRRKCLALSVLGEIGLRSGSSSPLTAKLFGDYFEGFSHDVSLAAAGALGQAAAGHGNVQSYVPVILSKAGQKSGQQYLALHSLKEILRYNDRPQELAPFSQQMWQAAVASSESEDNKTVGAECLALLVMLEPKIFLTALQALLHESSAAKRGNAVLALRDVFTNTDSSYNKYLRPITSEILASSLRDNAVDNRRLAMNTFNAAARNKPDLVMPHIHSLLPLVLAQTHEDPALIREVSMGPFKHKVDDGLEVRKSAYETLNALLEGSPSRIDPTALLDRAIAGIADEASIRSISCLMIIKLAVLAPELTTSRLNSMTDKFRAVLGVTLKDTAVRHDHEKANEAKKSVVKLSVELSRIFPDAAAASQGRIRWAGYLEDLRKEQGSLMREVEKELAQKT